MFKKFFAAVMSAAMILAISSCGRDEPKRPKPELTEEYQDDSYSLPVRVSSLEKKAEASKERSYFIDPFGEKQYYDITLFDIIIGENTDEDNEKLLDFIKSVDSVYHDDKYVRVIVEEEAGAYFAGQKSAEDVAEIIQNRVQNYLDENR